MEYELETPRLLLKPCRIVDVERAHGLWTDPGVRRFLFDDRIITQDEARSFVEASLESFEQRGYGLWLAFERGGNKLIGFAGLLPSEDEAPNLIYGMHPDFWGKGYATEAAGAVLRCASETLALSKIKADVDEPNAESIRVLERLGLRRVKRAVVKGRALLYFERSFHEGAGRLLARPEREEHQ